MKNCVNKMCSSFTFMVHSKAYTYGVPEFRNNHFGDKI